MFEIAFTLSIYKFRFLCFQWGQTAIACAAHNGHIDIVKLLIERGATVEGANGVSWCVILFLFLSLSLQLFRVRLLSLSTCIYLTHSHSLPPFLTRFLFYQHRPIYFYLSQSTDHHLFLSLLPPLCHSRSLSLVLSFLSFFNLTSIPPSLYWARLFS